MKRQHSFDSSKVTRLADNARQVACELRETAVAIKALVLEAREIYYVVSPLLERRKSK